MEHSPYCDKKSTGFLLGMFSLMDVIMDRPLGDLLQEVDLPQEVKEILLGTSKSPLRDYLQFAISYERWKPAELPELNVEADVLVEVYMQCIKDTDWAFRSGQ